ncbi:gamma-glutamyl-gamma-aminobutyrate hydrolase family protein [Halarcobacter sp.]|uniref:gamma-glutamyl-gamma-aminobutyrate hydrolase family protein n=1 Tax=Halarcobacter sp. TaxID=2321133 RepID=UPI0029F4A3F6|nr:gamma-glutamyl-gamma-aminobutyrate hydrolase family protein [Halarcobacter sp.]
MKKIVVSQRLIQHDKYYEIRECLDIKYSKLIEKCGFLPIILPTEVNFKNYFNELKIDGIFLTGGNDLYIFNQSILSQKRDIFEYDLIKYAIDNNIPIYGICRGMQIIAKYFDSKLKLIPNHINSHHKIVVNKESKYFKYLKNIETTNSFHKYGIDILGKGLIISAKSNDGIIEAIEHEKYKIFAQMWHSERTKPFCKNELDIIKKFFTEEKN